MATIAFASRNPAVDSLGRQAMQAVNAPIAKLRAWSNARKTISALSQLDDKTLRDIGIVRGNIGDIVHNSNMAR